MTDLKEFETMLVNYRDISQSIRLVLYSYEREIIHLSTEIANVDFEHTDNLFDKLYEIQNYLAIAFYKYEFQINEKLKGFVYHFDRDDSYSRKYWYQKFLESTEWFNEINNEA